MMLFSATAKSYAELHWTHNLHTLLYYICLNTQVFIIIESKRQSILKIARNMTYYSVGTEKRSV